MNSNVKSKSHMRFLLVLMAILLLLISCSCGKNPKNEIVITPESEYTYSKEYIAYAETVIFNFMCDIKGINQSEIDKLQARAEKINNSLPKTLDQKTYYKFYSSLSSHSEQIAQGIKEINGENPTQGFEKIKKAYLELTGIASSEYIGAILYNTMLVILDEKYDAQIKAYEKDDKQIFLDKANEYKANKEILINEIGKENISRLVKHTLFLGDLYYGGAFEDDQIKAFTNEELLIFVKSLDLSELTITEKGYELILSTCGEATILIEEKSFLTKVLFEASKNGDTKQMGTFLKELIAILSSTQEKMTIEDIELLRQNKANEVINRMLSRLENKEWERLDIVCKQEINKDTYNKLASEYYGGEFDEYLSTGRKATINELIDSCGKESFNQTLKEYIFGICPAFSYDMNF